MKREFRAKIEADGTEIRIVSEGNENDYISLTDIAKRKTSENPGYVIQNWMRNRSTVAFLGLWERLYNPQFNCLEFEAIESEAGMNAFVLTPKRWVETTNAIGMRTKAGRYAATYAHKDIAFEFASWISPEFKLYIIKEYQRLKEDENSRLSLNWNLNREISKLNYKLHTDAVKNTLIPPKLTKAQITFTYASEADLLNTVLFGKTAKEWRNENPGIEGNIRDHATIQQLLVLANMESYNAILIRQGKSQKERMELLHELATQQMSSLNVVDLSKLTEFR